jgi:acetyltransferase-like isoleucine patch superfamily enzyme
MLKPKLQSLISQTLVGKLVMQLKLKKRGIQLFDLTSEVSLDIIAEVPVKLGKVDVLENVRIGKHSFVTSGALCSNTSIGRYCSIANNVLIGPAEHPTNYLSTYDVFLDYTFYKERSLKKTIIGNDVWIGANAVIRRGIKIGDGAVVGAGAIVLSDVPPYAIVAGVPAKIIRYRFNEEIIKKLLELKWWEIDETLLSSMDFSDIEKCIKTLDQLRKLSVPL